MFKKAAAIASIIIGISIVGIWVMILLSGGAPELKTEPIRICTHIFSEALTAAALLAGGIGMLAKRKWADRVFTVSLGLLMYSVLTGFGYYTQLGQYPMTAMFSILFVLAVVMAVLVRAEKRPERR